MSSQHIKHEGIIQDIDSEVISVMVLAQSACGSCHAKSACGMSEMKEKIISVPLPKEKYQIGEKVNVIMSESLGMLAVLFSYLIPVVMFILLLVLVFNYTSSEPLAGLVSIVSLTGYYFILFAFRKRFKKKFSFKISKLDYFSNR